MFNEAWRYNFMDYILSHNWLFLIVIAYSSLVILKWFYVVRRYPYMIRCMREMRPEWNRSIFMFMQVWLPITVFVGAFIVVPVALFSEGKSFFASYSDEEMRDIAAEIVRKGDAV